MIETHPFGIFSPPKPRYLVLGSFTTKEAFDDKKKEKYVWFYSNGGRNNFWPILSEIYGRELKTREQMQKLFVDLEMALGDIIYQCERVKNSNLDVNLINIVYATENIKKFLNENNIQKIFFTSRFVETKFRRVFKEVVERRPNIELVTLPSPSPRYAQMTRSEKIKKYKETLPVIY